MNMEGEVRASIPEKETRERIDVPDRIFTTWVEANLMHPQEDIGIAAYLGEELFSGNYSLEAFSRSRLSEAQLETITRRMHAAHGAKDIEHPTLQTQEAINGRLNELWSGIRTLVISIGTNYTKLAIENRRVSSPTEMMLFAGGDALTQRYYRELMANLNLRPQLRTELAQVFSLLKEGLQQEELKRLERERHDLLNYKKQGAPISGIRPIFTRKGRERRRKTKRADALRKQISSTAYSYVARRSSELNLSIDLSRTKEVKTLFTMM